MKSKEIKDMLRLQKTLNDSTNGVSWVFGLNSINNKTINWLRCVHMEVSEFIDSSPWKHWKDVDNTTDIENQKVELVDSLHFLLSYGIHIFYLKNLNLIIKNAEREVINDRKRKLDNSNLSSKDFVKLANKRDEAFNIELKKRLSKNKMYPIIQYLNGERNEIDATLYNEFYDSIEDSLVSFFKKFLSIEFKSNKDTAIVAEQLSYFAIKGSILESNTKNNKIEDILQKEMILSKILPIFNYLEKTLSFNTVRYYFGKNVLNKFRQDNGYKEGSYKKIWKIKEDNVVMLEIVHQLEVVNFDTVYNALKTAYNS